MTQTASFSFANRKTSSNLERFLQCVTPSVPWRTLPQSCLHDLNSHWQQPDKDTIQYFTLGELWDCYNEWSAYGAGIPIQSNGSETAMQFYVPYLSAIQIYTSKPVAPPRNRRYDSDMAECESDSWSDDSWSDNLSRSLSNNSSRTWDAVSEDSFDQDGSWSLREKLGYLSLQYMEMSSPYWRVPLLDKITELTQTYPALNTLRSVDLSPASWMAVSWYPIYHIPSQINDKDFSTCFLTYHTLSSSFQGQDGYTCSNIATAGQTDDKTSGSSSSSCLFPFGLATYRMQGDLWLQPETSDYERMVDLYHTADSWLKQLNVHHHDFNFFSLHSTL
ncbi:uncharacterized protein LOC111490289 isoform X2 [Cucurbita maxima]|uniref:Uncharacterized protein LOC111490289 isoform X2 n=1 Tax=Cucurbita maxima TaxID=3661 RepID=A0A6J1K5Q3_CUCMA|nr:uncharacterized protein LOC111490289 isoform X2 [Cucurbita maxima]